MRAGEYPAQSAMSSVVFAPGRWLSIFVLASAVGLAGNGAKAAELGFSLRIENGRVPEDMRIVRVEQGDVVTLRWTVDQPLILHLHGYDIERRIDPGTVGEMRFTARATGRFPVHVHAIAAGPGARAHDETPLVYVEVYPR
jgi:hypothetical protein